MITTLRTAIYQAVSTNRIALKPLIMFGGMNGPYRSHLFLIEANKKKTDAVVRAFFMGRWRGRREVCRERLRYLSCTRRPN